MANTTEIVVRYAETDQMGVVHHAVYPIWFEIARTEYIKAVGMSYSEMEREGVMLPVTAISCRYRLPAKYDDVLEITARITRFSPARIEFVYEVRRKGEQEILTTGTSAHGFVDSKTFRPLNFKRALPEFYAVMEEHANKDMAAENN
ncbi:MAG: acyl-CoA thioesterase [Oscillospiraceae bacterium]|nr:acyl-CoA thioesterase [Oscillospiraceae bacterium]